MNTCGTENCELYLSECKQSGIYLRNFARARTMYHQEVSILGENSPWTSWCSQMFFTFWTKEIGKAIIKIENISPLDPWIHCLRFRLWKTRDLSLHSPKRTCLHFRNKDMIFLYIFTEVRGTDMPADSVYVWIS